MIRLHRIREITFGVGKDVSIGGAGSTLSIVPKTADTGAVNFGNGTKDIDVKVFLGSTSEFVLLDVGNSRLNVAKVPIYFSGTLNGKGLDFNDITLAAGSANNILSMGDSTAKEVTITTYFFPVRLNLESIANPSGAILSALMFLRFAVTTIDQPNMQIQGIGMTLESAFNVGYLHALEGVVNLTDDLTLGMSAHAGKFGLSRTSGKTITGTVGETLSAVLAQISGNGVSTGFGSDGGEQGAVLEAKLLSGADVTSMLWLNLLNGTSAVNGITVGNGGSGDITNLFWFVNADAGNCVVVGAYNDPAQASDGLIRILVGSTAYFVPFYGVGKVTGEW